MKKVLNANLEGKTVLLRADLNSEILNGKAILSERITESAKTIQFLKNKGAKVVVISHQGRPGKKDFTSLKSHAKLLNRFVKIKFIHDITGKTAQKEIKNLKKGGAILLENVRKLKDEFKSGKTQYVKTLSSLCDIYVNDAFSASHRVQTSIVTFPKYMESYAGPILEKEVNAIAKISLKNCLYILGGAKPDDNILLLNKNKVLTGGLFGPMCLVALGKKLGKEEDYMKEKISDYNNSLKRVQKKLKKTGKYVKFPVDFGVEVNGKRKNLSLSEFPNKFLSLDIGDKTQEFYIKEIKKAKSIYMKGPLGYYPDKKFREGTINILKAISESKGFTLLGGGDLSTAIKMSGIKKEKFGHVSLSGGALLDYIAGKKLPGLEALGFYRK